MSQMKIQHDIIINLPVEEVFAYMSNLEKLEDWSSFVLSSRKISTGEMLVGTIVQCRIRNLGIQLDIAYEVIECMPNRYFSYKSIMGIASSFTSIRFEPLEGGTRVMVEIDIHFTGGYLGYDEALVTQSISHQTANDLQILKDLMEITSSSSQ